MSNIQNQFFLFTAQASPIETGLILTFVGMLIVFSVLISIMLMLIILRKAFQKKASPTPTSNIKKTESNTENKSNNDSIPPEVLAVITAAAFAVMKKPIRVRRVKLFHDNRDGNWRNHGREKLMNSHIPRR